MGWLAAQGAIMAIGIFIGLVCSVIGLFFGHIILFDSIALGIAAGVCCNQFTAIHPALCLVIGIATFLLLLWLQNTSIGFWLVGGLLTLNYAAVFGLLAYFISEHDPIWGWVIGLNEMFKIVEREDDIIANEEKVFDGFLRTINTEILGADLIDVGLILRALTVEPLFVKIKVHLTKRFFILTERSFACNVFSCTF